MEVTFMNASTFPVYMSGWRNSRLEETYVPPDTTCMLRSDSGEFYADRCFPSSSPDWEKWQTIEEAAVPPSIGKFRSSPCARGDYSWMHTDKFNIVVGVACGGKITATFIEN
jgi:hypothetical protein